ncbi:hypothetical protein ACQP1O_07975 [Nocardia sp. CA-151230]|uniref:hypothetical protein n=1 Tax=Nocardia sp. CA-151230 TaxID=3239982 RepID=UPI003D8D33E5
MFTLGLVGWTLAVPQLRRMILGADRTLDDLRPAVAAAVETLSAAPSPAKTDPGV